MPAITACPNARWKKFCSRPFDFDIRQHRTIPALRLKHRSGSCGTASALPKCSIMSGCGTRIVLRGQSPSHSATAAPASVRCFRHWRRSPLQHPVLSALLAWHLPHLARHIGTSNYAVLPYIVQTFCFLLFKEGTTMPVKSPYTSALARRVTWQLTLTATGRQATWVGSCSMQTPRQVVAPPKPCGPKPVALMASNSSFSSAA